MPDFFTSASLSESMRKAAGGSTTGRKEPEAGDAKPLLDLCLRLFSLCSLCSLCSFDLAGVFGIFGVFGESTLSSSSLSISGRTTAPMILRRLRLDPEGEEGEVPFEGDMGEELPDEGVAVGADVGDCNGSGASLALRTAAGTAAGAGAATGAGVRAAAGAAAGAASATVTLALTASDGEVDCPAGTNASAEAAVGADEVDEDADGARATGQPCGSRRSLPSKRGDTAILNRGCWSQDPTEGRKANGMALGAADDDEAVGALCIVCAESAGMISGVLASDVLNGNGSVQVPTEASMWNGFLTSAAFDFGSKSSREIP
mmetsp:Transcript_114802/g.297530  ORF Transcript_114802/g.297530 Transcript_114802/m.297530 type:complete len:317 (+) Transcript_114802:817-1767(+)